MKDIKFLLTAIDFLTLVALFRAILFRSNTGEI